MVLWVLLGAWSAWAGGRASAPLLEELEQALSEAERTFDEAEPASADALDAHFADAFAVARKTRDPLFTAVVRLRMADVCRERERAQEALFELEHGIVGLRKRITGPRRASTEQSRRILNLGPKAFSENQALAGTLQWPESRPTSAWLGQRALVEAVLLMQAGNLYQAQQQLEPAAALYDDARTLADRHELEEIRPLVRINEAWLHLRREEPAAAIERIQQALELGAHDVRIDLRGAWLAHGAALVEQDHAAHGLAILDEARTLYDRAQDADGAAIVQVNRGRALEALGRLDDALEAYRAAATQATGDVRWAAPLGQARIHRARGDAWEAWRAYDAYLRALGGSAGAFGTDEGRFSILEAHASNFDDVVRVALEIDEPNTVHAATLRVRQRSLPALYARDRPRVVYQPGVLPPEAFQLVDLAPSMAEQSAEGTSVRRGGRLVTEDLEGYQQSPFPAVGITVLAYTVLPEQIVITVSRTLPTRTEALTTRARFATVDVDEETLATTIRAFRASLGTAGDRVAVSRGLEAVRADPGADPTALARQLHAWLVEPVRELLPSPDDMLVVVPDGPLWTMPFAALQAADGSWFADRLHTLAVSAESFATLEARPNRPRAGRALVVGDPGAGTVQGCGVDLAFAALPGAEAEARALAELDGWSHADLLLGSQADALRLDAWHRAYDVVHLATHGIACGDDPLASFVLLGQPGDEVWTAAGDEVSRTDDPRLPVRRYGDVVESRDPPQVPPLPHTLTARNVLDRWSLDADLVTLSACESGLGQSSSEGVIGLTRAFLASGARSVLVSLWPVEDEATRDLMVAFYAHYLEHGHKALALRDAMAEVRARAGSPRQWAAFMLVGAAQ